MWSVRCVYSENLLINVCYFKVVSLHNPELTTKFLSNITEAFILTSNLYNGKPWTFNELRNSVGCRLLFIFSVPSSLLTLSALYNVMIGVSYKNFLIPPCSWCYWITIISNCIFSVIDNVVCTTYRIDVITIGISRC